LSQAFGNFTGPVYKGGDSSSRADLIYNLVTGEVFLDQSEAAGGIITNFVLIDNEGALNTGVVDFPFPGILKTDLPTEISQTDGLMAGMPTDVWNLGPIFPTGMSLSALEAFLDQAFYVGALGSGVQDFDLVAVPEPATLVLLAAVAAGLLIGVCRRCRHHNSQA